MIQSPIAVGAAIIATVLVCGLAIYFLRRPTPAERERRRRLQVNRRGRITDGVIVDVIEPAEAETRLVHYTYSIGGVDYEAWQDVAALQDYIGVNSARLIGPVYVKYQSKNPGNSIVLCEEWTGLHPLPPA